MEHTFGEVIQTVGYVVNVAEALTAQERFSEAEALYRRAMPVWEDAHGPHGLETAQLVSRLADTLHNQAVTQPKETAFREKLTVAESLYRRALRIVETAVDRESQAVVEVLESLTRNLSEQGRRGEAIEELRRVLGLLETNLGPEHLVTLRQLGVLLAEQGEYSAAEEFLRRAAAIAAEHRHPDVIPIGKDLAKVLRHLGQEDEAQEIEELAARTRFPPEYTEQRAADDVLDRPVPRVRALVILFLSAWAIAFVLLVFYESRTKGRLPTLAELVGYAFVAAAVGGVLAVFGMMDLLWTSWRSS